MKLTLNRDYARRHLFVTILMTGLGLWFAFDGLIRYPSRSAADLYRSIEKSDPPEGLDLDSFKRQKTQTQYGFAALALLAAFVVGFRLRASARFSFEYDTTGFSRQGRRFSYDDVAKLDLSRWNSKSIAVLKLKSGGEIVLDAWHHLGVKEFVAEFRPKAPQPAD